VSIAASAKMSMSLRAKVTQELGARQRRPRYFQPCKPFRCTIGSCEQLHTTKTTRFDAVSVTSAARFIINAISLWRCLFSSLTLPANLAWARGIVSVGTGAHEHWKLPKKRLGGVLVNMSQAARDVPERRGFADREERERGRRERRHRPRDKSGGCAQQKTARNTMSIARYVT
jgi:hypothetical protein